MIKELAKDLCKKSPCHHKCRDTKDCIVEDDAKELFKQALVEGVNKHIDKTIEIEVITYEQDRFNHFINLMEKAQKSYDRLYKRYKDSPYLFEGTTLLSDAGRELQFYKDVIAMLGQGNQKQSEGEWKYQFTLDGDRFYECSVCGRQVVINCLCNEKRNAPEFYPYCHCGAKMKGGEE